MKDKGIRACIPGRKSRGTGVRYDTGEYIVACTDARALLAKKHAAVTALIAEAEDRKRQIEALMAELEASRQKRITVGTA